MAANTELEIYNFEGNLEQGFSNYFSANGITLEDSNGFSVLPDNFVAVQAEIGRATGHISNKGGGGNDYSQYEFSVRFTVRTEQAVGEEASDANIRRKHHELVSLVRQRLAVNNAKGTLDAYLPYYEINTFVPDGTTRVISDKDVMESVLTYVGQFDVRTTAWIVVV